MRYLFIAAVTAWWGLGCATVTPAALPPARLQDQDQLEALQRRYEEALERSEELACRLAAAEAALEVRQLERAEAEQAEQALSEELARVESERHLLEDHNAQLQARQKELAEMHEQMADVWFESALSRARRHSAPPEPPAPSSGGGQGASP
jgi:Na+-translocating ferredoxin:NAD+ oxidoreductase RnfC subunit